MHLAAKSVGRALVADSVHAVNRYRLPPIGATGRGNDQPSTVILWMLFVLYACKQAFTGTFRTPTPTTSNHGQRGPTVPEEG